MVEGIRTCFRFRSVDEAIEVLIEGEADWVTGWREKLGLLDIGWLERLSTDSDD